MRRLMPSVLGLASTEIEDRAVPSPSTFPVRVPVARLLGRRAFTVVLPSALPDGCRRATTRRAGSRGVSRCV